jgi:hypothetical protein
MTSYGVVWKEGSTVQAGKLELDPLAVRLEGLDHDGQSLVQELAYRDLSSVRVARKQEDRLEGRPTLILERLAGAPVQVASVAQAGVLSEIAEQLSTIPLGGSERTDRVAIVVPFKPQYRQAVEALVAQGPPFDPDRVALERHDVLVTEREVIFVFEGSAGEEIVRRLMAQPQLWRAALAWRKYLNGQPRIARQAYSWSHAELD